jgi:hypothetical protein
MHSKAEAEFADLLTKQKIKWIYHPKAFKLGWTSYQPDFYLPNENLYVEIIGSGNAYNAKIDDVRRLYPKIKLLILYRNGKPFSRNSHPLCSRKPRI